MRFCPWLIDVTICNYSQQFSSILQVSVIGTPVKPNLAVDVRNLWDQERKNKCKSSPCSGINILLAFMDAHVSLTLYHEEPTVVSQTRSRSGLQVVVQIMWERQCRSNVVELFVARIEQVMLCLLLSLVWLNTRNTAGTYEPVHVYACEQAEVSVWVSMYAHLTYLLTINNRVKHWFTGWLLVVPTENNFVRTTTSLERQALSPRKTNFAVFHHAPTEHAYCALCRWQASTNQTEWRRGKENATEFHKRFYKPLTEH